METYSLSGLSKGDNKFRFETANEYMYTDNGNNPEGTVELNPGGLIYEAKIMYLVKETAWGDGTGFGGKHWATYFECTIP